MNAAARMRVNRRTGWIGAAGLAVAAAVAWTSLPARAWAQAEKLPQAEDILDKSIDALGGKAAFEKLRNRVIKGTAEMRGSATPQVFKGTITSYEAAPHKSYVMLDLEGVGQIETGTDGETYWEINPVQGARLLEGDEKALQERTTVFNAPLYWRKLYKKVECVAAEDVSGAPCYKVVATPLQGKPETTWYDQKTYLPVKSELTVSTPIGEQAFELVPSDYRKVDGVLLPHKATQKMAGLEQVFTFESIKHNVDLPADRFDVPAKVKELGGKPKSTTQPATSAEREKAAEKKTKGGDKE
jgi:hypothetical protein